MEIHQQVRVRTRFDGGWSNGFAISGAVTASDGRTMYEVKRMSDGAVLPMLFGERELRVVVDPA